MDPTTYRFEVGEIECTAASDGEFEYGPPLFPPPARLLFSQAPATHVSELLLEEGTDLSAWSEWTSQYTCLLIRTSSHLVLVDTGAGSLGPGTGRLLGNLAAHGIGPEEIDTVILTHAHPDHLGGNTDPRGGLSFPKARWLMSRAEWEFWMEGEAERTLPEHGQVIAQMARPQLTPLTGTIELTTGEIEVVPGVHVIPTPGHTPGHLAVLMRSLGEELLCTGDLFLHPVHVREPGWVGIVDALPEVLTQTRRSLLDRAAADRPLVMCFHFPFPGVGRVGRAAGGWRWEPAPE